jgi:hypothetical protein
VPKYSIGLKVPSLPNFIAADGFSEDSARVDVADLDDPTLRELGAEWTDALVKHAAARRKERERQTQRGVDEFIQKRLIEGRGTKL